MTIETSPGVPTMPALVYEAPRVMTMRDVPIPVPEPDEVLIEVEYSGICGSELSGFLGQSAIRRPPLVFGHEISGRIAALGSGVGDSWQVRVSERVTANPLVSCGRCDYCTRGRQQLCPQRLLLGATLPGGNARYVAVPVASVLKVPDSMDLATAAMVEPVAFSLRAVEVAAVTAASRVLVVGAGAIGLLILQVLAASGVRTRYVVERNKDRLAMAVALGASPWTQERRTSRAQSPPLRMVAGWMWSSMLSARQQPDVRACSACPPEAPWSSSACTRTRRNSRSTPPSARSSSFGALLPIRLRTSDKVWSGWQTASLASVRAWCMPHWRTARSGTNSLCRDTKPRRSSYSQRQSPREPTPGKSRGSRMTGVAPWPGVERSIAQRLAVAHDASHFFVVPCGLAVPDSVEEVVALLTESHRLGRPMTFRSGGTSLSGQGQSASLLVDTRRHFRPIEVLDDGRRVRVGPGATVRQVNARLAPHGFRLGPDPASEAACTVGGVIANNSSGMLCGTEFNAYRTLESIVVALPSGTVIDTAAGDADQRLREAEPLLHQGLVRLRERVMGNASSVQLIDRLFAMKNTMGYAVNALVDYSRPVDILTHLLVGSEGTLGFVAEATFRTVRVRPHVATGFLVFASLRAATQALPELVASGLAAIEVLDATALRVAQRDPAAGRALPGVTVDQHAGLLVEYQEISAEALADRVERAELMLRRLPLSLPGKLTEAPRARADLWHLRKGLYAAVAGNRPSGTTALLEDIAVPVPALAGTCEALTGLFDRHGYEESVIFGHAKDGNIHFLLNERFDRPKSLSRFTAFTDDMVELVLGAGGTLKAEHGTGRMMAPFVRHQYGDELYDVMREIKSLFDPAGILNPGVVISDDPSIHLQHLKTTPTVEAEVDRCVECGYCEPVCPSRDLTLTPRQRIVLRRERARALESGDRSLVRELDKAMQYQVVESCAVDGMCATACPVLIDTGALVKRLREAQATPLREKVWTIAARQWAGTTALLSRALTAAQRVPAVATSASRAARELAGHERVPQWDRSLPAGGPPRLPHPGQAPVAVYMPACVGTMFGPEPGYPGAQAAFLALCELAGVSVTVPEGIAATCCGTPFTSKGLPGAYRQMQDRVVPWLWHATDGGRLPVVTDAASCTEGLRAMLLQVEASHGHPITVVDAISFVRGTLLPRLPEPVRLPSIMVHPTCSTTRLGLTPDLLAIASVLAREVEVPADWGCCGFAGDRGLLHPELTASATGIQAAQVRQASATAHASANRTCEIGLSRATGQPYAHVLEHFALALDLFPTVTPPQHKEKQP